MFCLLTEFVPLLGFNDQSIGWNIITNNCIYNNCNISTYPANARRGYQVGDSIIVILDLTTGVLSFYDDNKHLGPCFTGLQKFARNGQSLYPAVSITYDGAIVAIQHLYSSDRTGF